MPHGLEPNRETDAQDHEEEAYETFLLTHVYVGDPNSILVRHRKFLASLEQKKTAEREHAMLEEHIKDHKEKKFREQAAKQREKIKGLK